MDLRITCDRINLALVNLGFALVKRSSRTKILSAHPIDDETMVFHHQKMLTMKTIRFFLAKHQVKWFLNSCFMFNASAVKSTTAAVTVDGLYQEDAANAPLVEPAVVPNPAEPSNDTAFTCMDANTAYTYIHTYIYIYLYIYICYPQTHLFSTRDRSNCILVFSKYDTFRAHTYCECVGGWERCSTKICKRLQILLKPQTWYFS